MWISCSRFARRRSSICTSAGCRLPSRTQLASTKGRSASTSTRSRFPIPVFDAWRLECAHRGVHPAVFLRSLIDYYLLSTREHAPEPDWAWEGKLYKRYRSERLDEKAVITHGAKRALMRRATLRGARPSHVVRGLILGAMRGEYQSIPLVTAAMMYDDESRYYTGETRAP